MCMWAFCGVVLITEGKETCKGDPVGEEIRIPSSTEKYEIVWVPKTGMAVVMLKEFTLSERKVIEISPHNCDSVLHHET